MNILLLGGLNAHNQPWIRQVEQALKPLFDQCVVHEYAHWQTGNDINLESELAGASAKAQELGDYVIFAKSIGTVISAMGISRQMLKPKACIFVGVPLGLINKDAMPFTDWLSSAGCPLTFVQNSGDPAGSYDQVKTYLQGGSLAKYNLIELPGDTHDYSNLDELKKIVERIK